MLQIKENLSRKDYLSCKTKLFINLVRITCGQEIFSTNPKQLQNYKGTLARDLIKFLCSCYAYQVSSLDSSVIHFFPKKDHITPMPYYIVLLD